MTRYGPQFGPDITFLGVDRVDLDAPAALGAADVEMPPGEIERSLHALEEAVYAVARAGAIPLVLGGDHSIALSDATGVARHHGFDRVSMIHFDAHADTGHAPGTGTPEPGGLSSRQLLDAVRRICRELPVAGIDVVEVSPPYDHAEITAFLANRVCLEALSGLAARRHGISHDPAGPLLEGR
ncbi:arginase family protein [Nocardioides sp. LMS-CY]|uniref:arginase family protein n=1 Tax=Nocardioides sp. (strain LMS-CY) TaxID=2840457 RepID=UPI001C001C72|nr:arginase family protein [Nocardioides sp. LMS-CY]QWF24020.1 arginase family protein [Nocardioides sp. LMS-CY]